MLTPEGFYLPRLDPLQCSRCGLCERHCPLLRISAGPNRPAEQVKTYAAWTADEAIRRASSSGGIFTALARSILEQKGVVFGVTWDGDGTVRHTMAETEEQLGRLRGSKYLQSRVGSSYLQVMQLLENGGGPVLFTGLPCQVAALRTFVESDRLLLLDLACHGTPSITLFHKYLAHLAQGRQVTGVNFRDKRTGWSSFSVAIRFADGSEHLCTFRKDPFMIGFLSNLCINRACYDCQFCRMPRQGDITLADYWGVPGEYKNNLGVSLVLANNAKGDMWLERLFGRAGLEAHATPFASALRGNPRLVYGHRELPAEREAFFRDLHRLQFEELDNHYIQPLNRFKQA